MASAAGSLFARTYAGHTGVDPYTTAVSDVYQDLFGEGIFTGKGLYDVDAFIAALEGRVPENALLSHDLFEGLYARTALVTDVEVVDDYPSSVLRTRAGSTAGCAATGRSCGGCFRSCRRATGSQRNRLPLISRWKILDNLRRSLMAPATAGAAPGRLDRPARARRWPGRPSALAAVAFPVADRVVAAARDARGVRRAGAAAVDDLRTDGRARRCS